MLTEGLSPLLSKSVIITSKTQTPCGTIVVRTSSAHSILIKTCRVHGSFVLEAAGWQVYTNSRVQV